MLGIVPLHLRGQVVTFDDFADTSSLTLNGMAASLTPNSANALELTNDLGQNGSAFLTSSVSLANEGSFSTFFQFQISDPVGITDNDGVGADGLVFVIQPLAAGALGDGGGGLGYGGLQNSFGVEWDIWENFGEGVDIDGNHVGIDLYGSTASVASASIPNRLNDGDIWFAWIDYDGLSDQLEVRFAGVPVRPAEAILTHNVDLLSVFGTSEVFVGFTAATGGAGNDHDILRWHFVNDFAPFETNEYFITRSAEAICPEGDYRVSLAGTGPGSESDPLTVTECISGPGLGDVEISEVSPAATISSVTSPDRTEPNIVDIPGRVFVGNDCFGGSGTIDNGGGAYTSISTSGGDLWADGDDFEFQYAEVSGDFDVSIEMTSYSHDTGLGRWGKFGLMARQTDGDIASERTSRFTMIQAHGPFDGDVARVSRRLGRTSPSFRAWDVH